MKKAADRLLSAMLCLMLVLPAAAAETRQGTISLEGMEETIEETLFSSPFGFTFWYANELLEAYQGETEGLEGVVVAALRSDDRMVLSAIPEKDAGEYADKLGVNVKELSESSRVQMDVYREMENGTYHFMTLIAENGQYLSAVGEYSEESAEGNAKYFQKVLESVTLMSEYELDFFRELPGEWVMEYEGAGAVLTLEENGDMSLYCYSLDGAFAYTHRGTWSYEPVPQYSGKLTLHFTSTDDPERQENGYSVECAYSAYSEAWAENDSWFTYLILNPSVYSSGVTPFEELFGSDDAAMYRERKPNMRVVRCSSFVSLRESRSTSSKRILKVPLGALVLAFPEVGEENGFLYCLYHGEEGFILKEYLQPIE